MVLLQCSKFSLPSSSSQTTSFLLEPNSLSLALMHSDSSISLFSSLSFSCSSVSPLPPKPQFLIPPPSSSCSFIHLQNEDQNPRVIFLVAGPHKGGSQILFRFYALGNNSLFTKIKVVCNQKGLGFDSKLGVLVDVDHGVAVKIVGSINYFVMHSISSRKVWVFALKLVGDDGDSEAVKLMRCAVIECCVPLWSIGVSFGFLILGQDNGVRVFSLRQLVKGKVKKVKNSNSYGNLDLNGKLEGKALRLPNGVIGDACYSGSSLGNACNDVIDRKAVKQRSVRCREEDSDKWGACYVPFNSKQVEGLRSKTVKAISIQALSPKKFIILDSTGYLHVLCLSNAVGGSSISYNMRPLPHGMKVQKLAVFPDISSRTQTVFLSDGFHSVHMMTVSDMDTAVNKSAGDDSEEELMQSSVIQAIFVDEKVQDLEPLASNGILILGQGNLYVYAIP